MSDLRKILNANEKMLWEDCPVKSVYLTGATIRWLFFFIVGTLAVAAQFYLMSQVFQNIFMRLLFPLGWVVIPGLCSSFVKAFFSYSHIAYGITDKRVLVQSGIFNQKIISIQYDQILDSTVMISPLDTWCKQNTGSIMLSLPAITVRDPDMGNISMPARAVLTNIQDPYKIFKFFEKTALNVRTDMQYPNAQRPAENPGYQTELQSDKP